jgi:hypothetical protein
LANDVLLRLRQLFMRIFGRHEPGRVYREDAFDNCALLRLAGDDRSDAGLGGLKRFRPNVEAKAGHARLGVEPVAAEACIRHDGPDIAVKSDFGYCYGRCGETGGEKDEDRLPILHRFYLTLVFGR